MKYIPTLMADFYKISHRIQYPEGTTLVYSNLTARNDKYSQCNTSPLYDHTFKFFGLRYFLKNLTDIFDEHFFKRPIIECLEEYIKVTKHCLNDASYPSHIEALHRLGYLPLEIKALEEGSIVNYQIPVLTIKNTHPDFYWLTNFIETWLSADLWQISNSASIAHEYKKICEHYGKLTCDDLSHVQFQCHDFSYRGMAGTQSAIMSGMGHLSEFKGTDTIPAILAMEEYYNKDMSKDLIGCSIPASEHSVMCAGGKDDEYETFKRFITELYPSGFVSIVADTWDFWSVLTDILPRLKDDILARDGRVVIRPDSGDPVEIVCGLPVSKVKSALKEVIGSLRSEDGDLYLAEKFIWRPCEERALDSLPSKAERKGAVEVLWDLFGGTINEKGYSVLDSHIGLIYGDSITLERANQILKQLEAKGFASSNIVFGVGSYTYMYNTRDSMGWAVKATYCEVNGKGVEIYKTPKTDLGKKSAKGLLRVEKVGNDYKLHDCQNWEQEAQGELKLVYRNGVMG
jgi:nicotinamide phosphoribosyltransferase